MSKKEVKLRGLEFPPGEKNDRSTSAAGKNVLAAAIRAIGTDEAKKAADKCESEKNWRFKYQKHFMEMVRLSAKSPKAALDCANAGIDFMHNNFTFVMDGKEQTFSEYMRAFPKTETFHTATIQGTGQAGAKYNVPYNADVLSNGALKSQLNKWADYGTIEPDAASSIMKIVDNCPDLSKDYFILIGAGSAMGPFIKLLELGANVVAIDIPGKWGERPAAMWQRLIDTARKSSGSLTFPLNKPQAECHSQTDLCAAAGCNLTEEPARILNWLNNVSKSVKGNLTIGNYTYLDGDLHVKLSLAADAVIKGVCEENKKTNVAFLCTPTDIHVIPQEAHKAAKIHYGFHPGKGLETVINLLSMNKFLRKNALKPIDTTDGDKIYIVDGLSVAQGPNYGLAKRLQHWRAMVAFNNGHTVSSNIAPSTATLSVVSNRSFGWAYGGMPYFKPYEIFQQETTNALMTGLLVSDITSKDSPKNPKNRETFKIKNPLELFKFGSMHGGVWRAAYSVDSIGETSVIIHFLGGPKMFLPVVTIIFVVLAVLLLRMFH